jgi:hypothetical protein
MLFSRRASLPAISQPLSGQLYGWLPLSDAAGIKNNTRYPYLVPLASKNNTRYPYLVPLASKTTRATPV